jgi:hypothetical protein
MIMSSAMCQCHYQCAPRDVYIRTPAGAGAVQVCSSFFFFFLYTRTCRAIITLCWQRREKRQAYDEDCDDTSCHTACDSDDSDDRPLFSRFSDSDDDVPIFRGKVGPMLGNTSIGCCFSTPREGNAQVPCSILCIPT